MSEGTEVPDCCYVAVPGHLVAEAAGELIILDQQSGSYFGLNAQGKRVWELVQSPTRLQEIVAILVEEFDVTPERAQRDVEKVLEELQEVGLLTVKARV